MDSVSRTNAKLLFKWKTLVNTVLNALITKAKVSYRLTTLSVLKNTLSYTI